MMELDEAIKHCKEKAEELHDREIYTDTDGIECMDYECNQCAREHEQLAEWLTDYKRLKTLVINSPTVDITEEQAIDKLHETGWMQKHDKEMTERQTGKECELMKRAFFNAVETANLVEKLKQEGRQ